MMSQFSFNTRESVKITIPHYGMSKLINVKNIHLFYIFGRHFLKMHTVIDKCINYNVYRTHLCSCIARMSLNARSSATAARVSNLSATPSASIRHPARRISLSTITKRRLIRRIGVLAFVIAVVLYACGLRPVSDHLSHN